MQSAYANEQGLPQKDHDQSFFQTRAGSITRTSTDQWDRRWPTWPIVAGLRRAADDQKRPRLGGRNKVERDPTQGERFEKQRRMQYLQAELADVEHGWLQAGAISVVADG